MGKYTSPLTSKLTKKNWQDTIDLKTMSLDDMINLAGDMRDMESLGKAVRGYLKEAIVARFPDKETEHSTKKWTVTPSDRVRKGGLDEARILEDMGEQFVEKYRKEPTEYMELRFKEVE